MGDRSRANRRKTPLTGSAARSRTPVRVYPWLLPTVSIARTRHHLTVQDVHSVLRFETEIEQRTRLLLKLNGSATESSLRRSWTRAASMLADLEEREWLVRLGKPIRSIIHTRPERTRQLSYFAHIQPHLPERAFRELSSQSVLIIGIGGVGSHLAHILAGSGVRDILLNDFDVIERSNLNRQMSFTQRDVGRRKATVLKRELEARFPWVRIRCDIRNLDASPARLANVDAVFVCGECATIWDRPWILGRVPLLIAGYFGRQAVIGPLIAPHMGGTCWPCVQRAHGRARIASIERRTLLRSTAWNSSGASINVIAGGLLGEAATRLLAPSLGGPLLLDETCEIDCATMRMYRTKLNTRQNGPGPCFCGT